MKFRTPITRAWALALALTVAGGSPAWAGERCDAPPESWQPRSAVRDLAQRNGWHIDKLKVDDGCYEIKGRDAQGRRFKAKLDPVSLRIVKLKREKREGRGDERQRPDDPTSAAPANEASPAGRADPSARPSSSTKGEIL